MSTVARSTGQRKPSRSSSGPYAAGGGFATAVGAIVTAAGNTGVDNVTTRWAIAAVCCIAALTMFTAAYMHRQE